MLLAAGFSMLKNFSGTFEKNYASDICFLLVYGVLCVLLLKSFEIYGTVAEEALNGSIDFMKALIPAFGISMVFSSGAESSAAFYQLAFLVIYLVEWLFLSVLLPFIRVYVVTELFNHFFEDEKFQNFTELLAGVISWGMKSAMMAVLGLNVMQGLLAPAKDRLLNGAVQPCGDDDSGGGECAWRNRGAYVRRRNTDQKLCGGDGTDRAACGGLHPGSKACLYVSSL